MTDPQCPATWHQTYPEPADHRCRLYVGHDGEHYVDFPEANAAVSWE